MSDEKYEVAYGEPQPIEGNIMPALPPWATPSTQPRPRPQGNPMPYTAEQITLAYAISQLTAEERRICTLTGVTPEAYVLAKYPERFTAHGLTPDELNVCKLTGVTPEQYAKTKAGAR
jgi:hypothetical protein